MAPRRGIRHRILKKIQEPSQARRALPGRGVQHGYLMGRSNVFVKKNLKLASAYGFVGDEIASEVERGPWTSLGSGSCDDHHHGR